jgi:flagellar FliL protein
MDDIVVNPSGTRAKRFLVVSLAFIINGKKGIKEIEKREPAIKDGIIALLSRKSVDWLSAVDNRETLRREIRLITNRKLLETQVSKIYFTKYVLQ